MRDFLDDFVMVYLDDVLIFSKILKEYVEHVTKVLEKLEEKELLVKLSKYEFHKLKITFLGFVISENQIIMDPKKVKAIKD